MDQALSSDLRRIEGVYQENKFPKEMIDKGKYTWVPVPFRVLSEEVGVLKKWFRKGYLVNKGKALVLGSGDGRDAAFLNRAGLDVVGVEILPELVDYSRDLIGHLSRKGLVKGDRVKILEGGFLEDRLYCQNGFSFGDFQRIFAYLKPANFDEVSNKIEKRSKKGTEFISTHHLDVQDPKTNFHIVKTARLADRPEVYYDICLYRTR